MAFNAGAVYGQAIFDDRNWQNGINKLQKSNTSMIKSIFTADLAFEAFRKTVDFVTNKIKEGISKSIEYGETVNKFKVVFGNGTKVIKSASNAFSDLTKNYGLSNKAALEMLSSTGDLLTGLGFSQEQALGFSEQIQKLSVDLASFQNYSGGAAGASEALTKALLGETDQAKGLGIVIKQGTKEFNSQIKAMMESTGATEIQAKAQLILNQALEQSKNAIGDYARTSMSLANMQRQVENETENLTISIGQYFLPIIKDITSATLNTVKAFNDFVTSQKNMETIQETMGKISGAFSVFTAVLKDFGGEIFTKLIENIKQTKKYFDVFIGSAEEGTLVFDLLGGALKLIGISLSITFKVLKLQQQLWVDFLTVVREAGKTIFAVFQAMFNPTKWKEAKEQFDNLKESFNNLTTNLTDNIVDIVDTTVKEFSKFPESAIDNSKKYQDIWNKALDNTKKEFENNSTEIETIEENKTATLIGTNQEWLKKQQSLLDEWNGMQKKSFKDSIADVWKRADEFKAAGVEEVEVTKWAQKEIQKAWADQAQKTLGLVSNIASQVISAYNSIFDFIMDFQQQELDQLIAQNEAKIEEMETQKNNELESFDDKTQQMIDNINAQEEASVISKEQAETQIAAIEAQRAAEKEALEKKLDNKIAEQKKKNLEEENAREKKAFQADKANKIANVWLQAAIGIVGAWAQSIAQLGPIGGSIMAGVLTALMLGVAIAQTVVISQQKFVPKKQAGGMASGPTMINEVGGEIVTLPDGSQVIPNDISRQIAADSGGMKKIDIMISFAGAKISSAMDLKYVTDYVMNELGRKLDLSL